MLSLRSRCVSANAPAPLVTREQCEAFATLFVADREKGEAREGRLFDFIVANPPYVERGDPRLVSGDLRHEPRMALDGGVDGLDSIREIIAGAPRVLAPGGTLLLEHGYDQAPAVARLFSALGFRRIETYKDLAGQDRTTVGTVP